MGVTVSIQEGRLMVSIFAQYFFIVHYAYYSVSIAKNKLD